MKQIYIFVNFKNFVFYIKCVIINVRKGLVKSLCKKLISNRGYESCKKSLWIEVTNPVKIVVDRGYESCKKSL
ncbi:hypothetical protein HMPREF9094_1237 [Fusobacterium animalis ATCC 51191]|uniref:Uncharacterized protein n=1 Tax=Fusobacterium animalis ATCC 51191 TaxID=997347 RepID=F9EMT2_9FUSO|nr:hypothetical protein HMPREF9094_1237 [Fusobacterium animalis ATCC 51191]